MDGFARSSFVTARTIRSERPVVQRPRTTRAPAVLLVGASTGGPQALTALVSGLTEIVSRVPICVTLHMPANLVPVIAAHVARTCGVATTVVTEMRTLAAGTVYFAPGDRHLDFVRRDPRDVAILPKAGPVADCCKPAVDVMLASAAACFGPRALAIILSGMGQDGLAGARAVVAAGGDVVVQDKASSAVWGMPGAVAKANLASAILSPQGLADEIGCRLTSCVSVR